ncbi:glycosyl transferase group 1 [Methanofollis liminatans DSM 4140]|uniref:Glycosyl transferase group 1 n=1 Tax=Methanofollis liminatans DSM 4140 TaxID=28892 RepID=J1L125_9EURY|nr:glycosyltransferase family 4 protein [Methanofollis liminatans]EJG06717.1 glycosyl transferase group 1 [Methanofollis liminatans DSM 4140]
MDEFLDRIKDCNKIALLVPNFASYSGDARVVELQAKDLRSLGKDVDIITFHQEIDSDLSVIEIGMPKYLFWQRIYRLIFPIDFIKINNVLKDLKDYDLIISHLYPMNWLADLAKKHHGTKYIYWYHGIPTPSLQPYLYERIYLKLFIWATKITIQNADLVVSVSKSARDEVKGYTGLDSIVIYNKTDLLRFNKQVDGTKIRERYNLGDAPVILNVGRVCPPKGADLLIRAFNLLKKRVPEAKLIIIGKPTYPYYMEELKKMADSSVIFAGFVSDEELPYYYAACDVYATGSLWEANNVPVLEAQASGKPIVAFDFNFFAEELGDNDILVDRGNVEKFAEACILKLRELGRVA